MIRPIKQVGIDNPDVLNLLTVQGEHCNGKSVIGSNDNRQQICNKSLVWGKISKPKQMTGFRPQIIMKEAQWRQSSTIKSTEFVSLSYHSKRVIRLVMCWFTRRSNFLGIRNQSKKWIEHRLNKGFLHFKTYMDIFYFRY